VNALLTAKDFGIEDHAATLAAAWNFETDGANIALVGDAEPLVRVLSRTAHRKSGSLEIVGQPAGAFIGTSRLGMMLADPTLPESLTVAEYLALGAGLTGLGTWPARNAARVALFGLDLEKLGKRVIRSLAPPERRAIRVAQAVVGGPRVVLLEEPFEGLAEDERGALVPVIRRAATKRRLIATSRAPAAVGTEAAFLLELDHAVVFSDGRVTASGRPSDVLVRSATCVVWTSGACAALAAALTALGLRVEEQRRDPTERDAGRLLVHLTKEATTRTVVEAALSVGAPLLGLVPAGLEPRGAPRSS
jgi:ABC-2 type transport system ATP-binding protein